MRNLLKIILSLVLMSVNLTVHSQTAELTPPASTETIAPTETLVQQFSGPKNPQAAMSLFLGAMNRVKGGEVEKMSDALATMDLSTINPIVRAERGANLAWMLLEVMDRTRLVDLKKLPSDPEGEAYLFQTYADGEIRIHRDDRGIWLFHRETLNKIAKILDSLDHIKPIVVSADRSYLPWHIRFRQGLPASLKKPSFLLENWQWIGILFAIMFGLFLDKIIALALKMLVHSWQQKSENNYYREVSPNILRPIGLMALAFVWWSVIGMLGLPERAMLVLLVAVKVIASVSSVWATYRLVDLLSTYLTKRAEETESKLDDALVPLIPKTLKIFITVIGFVFVADNLNIDISSLLAGLGLGGLAFALAAKDMVQNLFGSVTILLDRTFSVGDWIVVEGVEGTVEQIGFRSTRVRTFYNSLITVPNSKFITADVDNLGERTYRRYKTHLNITYDTPPDRIEAFCEGIRELVRCHPYMRKDYYHVYLNGFSDSSVDILVYVFWETPDWGTELRERHRFLLDTLRLAEQLGVEFAFPTRTLFMQEVQKSQTEENVMSRQNAVELGQKVAKNIVKETTGLDTIPPPVRY